MASEYIRGTSVRKPNRVYEKYPVRVHETEGKSVKYSQYYRL